MVWVHAGLAMNLVTVVYGALADTRSPVDAALLRVSY
ncbi:MAG: hypothetical protein QOH92_3572 [Chloroflexota bacterium]|jgi:hypothetical protein|nr:hypothetical protein [Chloroflexota bacterium]